MTAQSPPPTPCRLMFLCGFVLKAEEKALPSERWVLEGSSEGSGRHADRLPLLLERRSVRTGTAGVAVCCACPVPEPTPPSTSCQPTDTQGRSTEPNGRDLCTNYLVHRGRKKKVIACPVAHISSLDRPECSGPLCGPPLQLWSPGTMDHFVEAPFSTVHTETSLREDHWV